MSVSVRSCRRGQLLPLKSLSNQFPREARPGAQLKPAQAFKACAPDSRGGSFCLAPVVLLHSARNSMQGETAFPRKETLR